MPPGPPDMDETGRPRRRRVVMQRKVSVSEYEQHQARMASLGLDPSDPAPSAPAEQALAPSLASSLGGTAARGAGQDATRGHTQRQVSLQARTIGEQILAGRHERALARFNVQQEEWEAFCQRAARRTGRVKEELVVARAEEHRERLEVMELLDRATPEEVKSGGHSWYHSLRGEGTRYVQIGNMFSGLHLPIKLHKEEYVHEIIRKPLLTELIASRELEGSAHRKRTWRDDEYLQARIRRYRKKMEELAPGRLETHETLEPEVIRMGASAPETSALSDAACEDDGPVEREEGASVVGAAAPASCVDVAPEHGAALRTGPHAEVAPDRLQFRARVRQLSTCCVSLRNVGTAAVSYEWLLHDAQHGFQESVMPDDPRRCFSCNRSRGRVLPGEEQHAVFTFSSATPGVFTSSWCLRTYPELLEPVGDVHMHGVATEADSLLERRRSFHGLMFQQQVLHQVQELIEDIVESVELQQPEVPDLGSATIQRRIFEEVNAPLGLYYTPHAWQKLLELGDSVRTLKELHFKEAPSSGMVQPLERSQALRGRRPIEKVRASKAMPPAFPLDRGAPAAQRLSEELSALPPGDGAEARAQVQLDLAREVRAAQRRPLERSPLWWLAYETVMGLALAIPEQSAKARSANDLKPLPFLPPPDEDASPDVVAQHEARLQARQELLGEAEREAEVRRGFVEAFGQEHFAPAASRFAADARQVSAIGRVQRAAESTLRERLQPYLERQSTDGVEMGGSVVLYELDLGFLDDAAMATQEAATPDARLALEGEEEERVRKRLQGVLGMLESSPLSLLVAAHLGAPAPEAPGACDAAGAAVPARWPRGLLSLEPLLEPMRDICQDAATSVEFVPHEAWLGDAAAFAERVRSDEQERKVFFLENLSALPEELGVRRTLRPESAAPDAPAAAPAAPGAAVAGPGVACEALPWTAREAWAARALGGGLRPDFSVLDSFSAACKSITSHEGLWLAAPQRIVGPSIEAELNAFVDALQLPFRTSEADVDAKVSAEALGAVAESQPEEGGDSPPTPLLVVLGGGGFVGPAGEEKFLRKLELLLGIARLVHHEKDGLLIVLAGELAVCVLNAVFNANLGAMGVCAAPAMADALREALLDVLGLGVQVLLPLDLVCEEATAAEAPPADAPPPQALALAQLFSATPAPAPLGLSRDGREAFAQLDLASGALALRAAEAADSAPASAPPEAPAPAAAEGSRQLLVRDVGEATLEALGKQLRRCRGVLWNGALGRWEDERWQRGTRAFLAGVEGRLAGGGEEEAEEEEEEDAEEEEDEDADAQPKPSKEELEPEAEFEVAVVIGCDSTRTLPSLMETPSLVTFVSQSGEGLLQVLRGAPIPGLLACAEQTRSN